MNPALMPVVVPAIIDGSMDHTAHFITFDDGNSPPADFARQDVQQDEVHFVAVQLLVHHARAAVLYDTEVAGEVPQGAPGLIRFGSLVAMMPGARLSRRVLRAGRWVCSVASPLARAWASCWKEWPKLVMA